MDNAPIDTDAAHALWADYLASAPTHWVEDELPTIERFGDHAELTDELLGLVIDGPKRATAGLVAEFERDTVASFLQADGYALCIFVANTLRISNRRDDEGTRLHLVSLATAELLPIDGSG